MNGNYRYRLPGKELKGKIKVNAAN